MRYPVPNSKEEISHVISEDQIKEILIRHETILAEKEAQTARVQREIAQLCAQHVPEEWIISEALSAAPYREIHDVPTAGDSGSEHVLGCFEDYLERRVEEKCRQAEAYLRDAASAARVLYACGVLPVKLREVVRIVYMECGSYSVGIREAAERLEISISTANRRRRQGIAMIGRIYASGLRNEEIIALTPDEVQRRFGKDRCRDTPVRPASGNDTC